MSVPWPRCCGGGFSTRTTKTPTWPSSPGSARSACRAPCSRRRSRCGWLCGSCEAGRLLPEGAEITLLHVAPGDVEAVAGRGPAALLGRHPHPRPGPALEEISAEEARAVLAAAQQRLGRPADLE